MDGEEININPQAGNSKGLKLKHKFLDYYYYKLPFCPKVNRYSISKRRYFAACSKVNNNYFHSVKDAPELQIYLSIFIYLDPSIRPLQPAMFIDPALINQMISILSPSRRSRLFFRGDFGDALAAPVSLPPQPT